jgi:hypothetical protein
MAGSECISYGVLTSMDKVKSGLAPVKQATDKAGVLLGKGRHEGESDMEYNYNEHFQARQITIG